MGETKIGAGLRVGEYVLKEKIGQGGFGQIWKAVHHVWPDRLVAVKLPTNPRLIDQLRREAEIQYLLQKLDDRHIVKILGLDTAHDPPYFIMEFVEGESLRSLLAREARPDLEPILDRAEQILMALSHAHKAHVIHMDLKPENILVTPKGVLKLMDFGLGYRPNPQEVSILLSGALEESEEPQGGTLEYMAPEVRRGDPPDPRADLYAFGVILFEMLTGERPQPGDRPSDLNPAVPDRLDEAFSKCYARVEKRYNSAEEVLEEIRRMRTPTPEAAGPAEPGATAPRPEAPSGMIFIPEGSFWLGEGESGDRSPAHSRFLEAFFLDANPVTHGEFLRFVRDGGYRDSGLWEAGWEKIDKFKDQTGKAGPRGWKQGTFPSGLDRHPVVGISVFEAQAFARWAGKRLPAEVEWEKAARGSTRNLYPWGMKFDKSFCNTKESGIGSTTAVGRYRRGASPFGVLDMAGNVLEWTANFYRGYPGNEEKNPYFGEFYRVLRGGCWYFKAEAARVTVRHYLRPELRLDYAGFRCAMDA
ncbi:MAG: bifunctional serine/threonine-protein kinase/formylglycine-generating enzyme family protein [Planctomycetota bacterium]|jgi:formylglycine-generating enzyme required for sulfatase activity